MNQIRNLTLAALLTLFAGAGCATHPQKVIYATLKAVKDAESASMHTYYSLYWQGKVSAESEVQIERLHSNFTVAFQLAVKVAAQDWEGAPVPANVAAAAVEVAQAVALLSLQPNPLP